MSYLSSSISLSDDVEVSNKKFSYLFSREECVVGFFFEALHSDTWLNVKSVALLQKISSFSPSSTHLCLRGARVRF